MRMSQIIRRYLATTLVVFTFLAGANPTVKGAFHLWQVKEVFTNASGSVQFVEMFDSFGGETSVLNQTLTANSDGIIKTFKFPSILSHNTPGSLLIAITGFGALTGAVTPDFTFDQSATPFSGSFFNPNATNITFTFSGSGDSMAITGAALPKDGIHSLTDAGAVGFPPGTPNISSGVNSPSSLTGNSSGINVSTGDYNGNHSVDAADYVLWRKNPADFGSNAAGYNAWQSNFGNAAESGFGSGGVVPEPTTLALQFAWFNALMWRVRKQNSVRRTRSI
jgi:hypothetical protein